MSKEKLAFALMAKFLEWNNVRTEGSSSPVWTDGQELNHIRKSIIYLKEEMKQLETLPEVYFTETPPKMPERFMVKGEEIRERAKETLEVCQKNEDYQFLFCHGSALDEQQKAWICLDGIINSILRMERMIRIDNLVEMKKYQSPDKYIKSFKICRKGLEELLEELEELKPPEEVKKPEILYEQISLKEFMESDVSGK